MLSACSYCHVHGLFIYKSSKTFLIALCALLMVACGQGGSSVTQQPEGPAGAGGEQDIKQDFSPQADDDESEPDLSPLVNAGLDQFADANVIIALTGTAEAQGESSITAVEWQQLYGPAVEISDPSALTNIIAVPDTTLNDQLIFSLQATDSEGRSSEDFTVISVLPLEVFVRVISTSVNEAAGTATLRVELSGPSDNDTFVSYKTIDGSAIAGVDYTSLEGELIIPAGETNAELVVELLDDGIQEADETLLVHVATETGETQNTGVGTLIIRNGDDVGELIPQTISFVDTGPVDGNVGSVLTNPVQDNSETAPGSGAVTYSSSNPQVASVDETTGEVTLLIEGAVVITAFKEEDNLYASAQASYNLNVLLNEQQISFEQAGPLAGLINDVVTNPLAETGEGTGAISYASSHPELASVDEASGEVNLLAPGTVTITATKAADETYGETSVSYDIAISLLTQTIQFTATGLSGAIGETVTNPLSDEGTGSGTISYSSSNTDVATVDSVTGEVQLLATGTATITATKAADATYGEASASYNITIGLLQSIQFTAAELSGAIGETVTNSLSEEGAGSGAISYSSNNTNVATVDAVTGEVQLLATGTATITATKAADATYAETSASFSVSVGLVSQTIVFEQQGTVELAINDSYTNTVQDSPGTGGVVYESSNTGIVTVDSVTGQVQVVGVGTVTITATKAADDTYAEATASYQISAELREQIIAFDTASVVLLVEDSTTVNLTEGGSGTGSIVYSSSNSDVASVNSASGLVTALSPGQTTITANKAADAVYGSTAASYTVTVTDGSQTISFAQSTLTVYINDTGSNSIADTGIGSGTITYSSSNDSVATVNQTTGVVSGNALGSATITATKAADAIYMAASDSYTVNVVLKPQNLAFQNPGPVTVDIADGTYSNPLVETGDGSGAITYTESDPDTAFVDSMGNVSLYSTGTVVITANKAADSEYDAATVSYTLIIEGIGPM